MSAGWFETVAEAQRRASRRLPPSVYGALVAGSEKGVTVTDNIGAFSELGFAPHVAGLSAQRDLSTTVMGQPVSLPVLISPTGVQAVHPDGEVAVSRAAAARGTVMGLSSFASKPVERLGRVARPVRRYVLALGSVGRLPEAERGALVVGALGGQPEPPAYGLIRAAAEHRLAADWAVRLKIKYGRLTDPVAMLSGGNQQKVVLARWLALRPKILIVDEPTRGIDIGSKVEVHNLLIEMAKSGIAVIVISSELPEILAVSDRIVTMREGRVTGEIARDNATQEILMSMMTAHESGGPALAAA